MSDIVLSVLIIGGYGNFGSTIARRLARQSSISLYIAGRNLARAETFCATLGQNAKALRLDITVNLQAALEDIKPDLVIHTSGPFQGQGYDVARAAISVGAHYIDLADGREFVCGITELDVEARAAGVMVLAGGSSVPTLTAAVLDHLAAGGMVIDEIDYGIATAQQTRLGQATTAATLSYAGHPFSTLIDGEMRNVFGWQGLHLRRYPELGLRFMSNVDVPDLDLFPERYPSLRTQRFYAGVEVKLLQLGIWALSWLVRAGLIRSLRYYAAKLAAMAGVFDWLGTDRSGFHLHAYGTDCSGAKLSRKFYLIAGSGDGPNIPCVPAVWMAHSLAAGRGFEAGARPCVGLLSLADYLSLLQGLDIRVVWQD